jgi:hypothetical protein
LPMLNHAQIMLILILMQYVPSRVLEFQPLSKSLRSSEGIEALVRVPDEWQAGCVLVVARLCGLSAVCGTVVVLVDFVDRKVLRVDVGLKLRLEGGADAAQSVP